MHRRSFTLSLLLWIATPLITTSAARAESYWVFVEKAAGILKTLWDIRSSTVSKASDYGIYTASFELYRYEDIVEYYDHGSKRSVNRTHWRDRADGKYHYLTTTSSSFSTSLNRDEFEHALGKCEWTCSYTTTPEAYRVNGNRVTVLATQYRLRTALIKAPTSAALLMDPIPVTAVWSAIVPSMTMCGVPIDLTGATINDHAYLIDGPILRYPITQGLSSTTPRVFILARTDPK